MPDEKKTCYADLYILAAFLVLWCLCSFIGMYYSSTWIGVVCTVMYITAHVVFLYYAYQYRLLAILVILGIFWLLGAVGMLWGLMGDHTIPLFFLVSVIPVFVGFAYGNLGNIWDMVFLIIDFILFLGIPTACAVLSVRLWKHVKRTEEK